jgi:hypothetical protein
MLEEAFNASKEFIELLYSYEIDALSFDKQANILGR